METIQSTVACPKRNNHSGKLWQTDIGSMDMELKTLGGRIKWRLQEIGMRPADLARYCKVERASVSKWVNSTATSGMRGENLVNAAEFLRCSAHWLSTGEGDWRAPPSRSVVPLRTELGDPVDPSVRPVVLVDSKDDIQHPVFEVPRYTVRASAGDGMPVLEVDTEGTPNYCRSGWAAKNGYRQENLFSIVVTGDSMEPTIPNGASLIVNRQSEIVNGKIHVICHGDKCYVKRLYLQMDNSVLIRSDNQSVYKDKTVDENDPEPLHIVGLVVSVSFNL